MKVAGRKNDGAWYRTNRWLIQQNEDTKTRLKADPQIREVAVVFYGIMGNMTGTDALGAVGIANFPASAVELHANWIDKGIPRQVYTGNLSWDTYDKIEPGSAYPPPSSRTNTGNAPVYAPHNQENARKAAHKLRDKMNKHRLSLRSLADIANQEPSHHLNPGGIADGNPNN